MAKTSCPVRVGDTVDLTLEALVGGGEAIAHLGSFAVFVPGGVPGDRIRARVISTKPGYARAVVTEVVEPGADRRPAPCQIYGLCGGCQWQELDYERQLYWKHQLVAEAFRRIGGLDPEPWLEPTLGMAHPWGYRNKVHWALSREGGEYRIGLYEPRSHRVVEVASCLIQHARLDQVLAALRDLIPRFGFDVYEEATGRGWLRTAFAKVGHQTGEVMVGLVTTRASFPEQAAWVAALRERCPGVTAIVQNVQPKPGNVLMGDTTLVLWGRDHLLERIGPLTFAISARSFFQVNAQQVEALYDLVAEFLEPPPGAVALDLYSGTGTIALDLARRGASLVVGLESIPEAVTDAKANADRNGITHARFEVARVEDRLPSLLRELGRVDAAVLDPPRKGCEPAVVEAIAQSGIPRLVYVSCNPATLARDLKRLCTDGPYRIRRARPVDMFPQTAHVEVVVLLERVQAAS